MVLVVINLRIVLYICGLNLTQSSTSALYLNILLITYTHARYANY